MQQSATAADLQRTR